ncbi:MAG TPA: hypothetical protein VH442_00340 [Micromonosporaceae bacterium]
MSADHDWRLMGQERFLAGATLRWERWRRPRPDWDHDHCAFCQAEFAAVKTEHVDFTAGYVTADDNYIWICRPCFEDFRAEFRWHVIVAPPS